MKLFVLQRHLYMDVACERDGISNDTNVTMLPLSLEDELIED